MVWELLLVRQALWWIIDVTVRVSLVKITCFLHSVVLRRALGIHCPHSHILDSASCVWIHTPTIGVLLWANQMVNPASVPVYNILCHLDFAKPHFLPGFKELTYISECFRDSLMIMFNYWPNLHWMFIMPLRNMSEYFILLQNYWSQVLRTFASIPQKSLSSWLNLKSIFSFLLSRKERDLQFVMDVNLC